LLGSGTRAAESAEATAILPTTFSDAAEHDMAAKITKHTFQTMNGATREAAGAPRAVGVRKSPALGILQFDPHFLA